jgi:hypothetical protein
VMAKSASRVAMMIQMLMRICAYPGNPRAPREFVKRSPRNIALHTAHAMRVPETPPFAPYHGWLRRGSRFATAVERPQGPDTLLTAH